MTTKAANSIELACTLHPQPGYPWQLDLRVGYRLEGTGLTVSVFARNCSNVSAPFGIGFHPYLTVGKAIDDAFLQIPATRSLVADDRGLPVGGEAVAGTDLDFTRPRCIGSQRLDTGYGDLVREADGMARAVLEGAAGRLVCLWVDPQFRYLMVYTGDKLEAVSRRRCAIAIEPMTCPPNALRSGTDLLTMMPGQVVRARWGLAPSPCRLDE
jgi:aldose 1-epimerase